jgi:hypothetical protein
VDLCRRRQSLRSSTAILSSLDKPRRLKIDSRWLSTYYLFIADINTRALDRELKRGSAELLILSLLEARPRHGYELSKLIHRRSGGN